MRVYTLRAPEVSRPAVSEGAKPTQVPVSAGMARAVIDPGPVTSSRRGPRGAQAGSQTNLDAKRDANPSSSLGESDPSIDGWLLLKLSCRYPGRRSTERLLCV